jgi:hypothetical protein
MSAFAGDNLAILKENTMAHTYSDSTGIYDIELLWEVTKDLPVVRMSLARLEADKVVRSRRSGFSAVRYFNCDTSYPLLVAEDDRLLDGRHRLAKMFEKGRKFCRVKVVPDALLQFCRIGEAPARKPRKQGYRGWWLRAGKDRTGPFATQGAAIRAAMSPKVAAEAPYRQWSQGRMKWRPVYIKPGRGA